MAKLTKFGGETGSVTPSTALLNAHYFMDAAAVQVSVDQFLNDDTKP